MESFKFFQVYPWYFYGILDGTKCVTVELNRPGNRNGRGKNQREECIHEKDRSQRDQGVQSPGDEEYRAARF
ncbi:hypothetical protein GF1_12930 [Desulfolithobacter dissulfuricans]|uniref:Uncharacterized protein n=1 Tax=Desulfolithobacter dissulfuricans TaxID=2795293 RepID=A0A915U5C3_9BACT|nr:hypothetical protein GF1_12930 [Desulfolithobacter dissulfuricans]